MDSSERGKQIWENATEKVFDQTLEAIQKFNCKQEYIIQSEIPIVDGKNIIFGRGEKSFNFSTSAHFNSDVPPIEYQDKGYGFAETFKIKDSQGNVFKIPKGASGYHIDLSKGCIAGAINEFIRETTERGFYRCIYYLNEDFQSYVSGEFVKCGNGLNKSLIKIQCNEHLIDIFSTTVKDSKFLIIDLMTQAMLEEFVEVVNAIICSFGFLSGCIQAGERHILQSDTSVFTFVQVAQFRKFSESIKTDKKVIWPFLLWQYNGEDGFLLAPLFSKMVTTAICNKQFLRALVIICEAHTYSFEIRAAAYSVALETMKNIVIDENEGKVSPFKDKAAARRIREAIIGTLNSFPDEEFSNKEAVLKRIEQINQPSNADSFKLAFAHYSVVLNEDDERCLRSRNDFLHGRLPFEGENEFSMNMELKYITLRMHHLVSILIMKHIGFSGYILNMMKLVSNVHGDKMIEERPFRKI